MSLDINFAALGAFRNVNFGNADAIANLKQGGGVERHGRLGGFFAKMFRSSATQASNFANKHADSETSCHENEGSAY